ncbi:hypothetical protein HD553DRAFT_314790 [Filobasidium floriforme]|uniref:uncharacterized protein n=1 Tax=Filobasidium floriforme TaxID=5210 RepID=UPI001E8D6A9E|nr:uncharacterized protein HD553DRAFT_314790 [Filobasidium floriforme]KAH8082396.1 hypothetical protein HD553DRAFT_314790 [Filobasidium floriforme]
MIHISALHGNLILAAIGRIAVRYPNELAIGSMSYGQLASNVLSSASNLLSVSLPEGMLGGYDLEEETVIMPGLGLDAKVVGLLATWAAGGIGTSSDHPGELDSPDLPLVFYDPSTSLGGEAHHPYRLAELELHDVRPRREGDETVYVDNTQVASWLAELELTDLERKAYVVENSLQGVDTQEAQVPIEAERITLTHRQVASLVFGINNNDPSPEQSQLPPKDLELFQRVARLLQQPGSTK